MKRVFSSLGSVEVGLRESVLDAANIPYEVRNESVAGLMGPNLGSPMELWVLRDEDYEPAVRLFRESAGKENGEPAAGGNAE